MGRGDGDGQEVLIERGGKLKVSRGVFRCVFLTGNYAVKVPRFKNFFEGLRCNRWEREMWFFWRPQFGWENLCPILFADPLGLLVVMPRAKQPVTFEDVVNSFPDNYPDITAETKPEDFGWLNGKLLALDYGLCDVDFVHHRREYYSGVASRGTSH